MPNSRLEVVHSDLYVVLVTVWLDCLFSRVKDGFQFTQAFKHSLYGIAAPQNIEVP